MMRRHRLLPRFVNSALRTLTLAGAAATVSMLSPTVARSAGDTIIEIDFTEIHDRLAPDVMPGIFATHQTVATLSAANLVSETNQTVAGRRRKNPDVHPEQNSEALGDNSARAVWHVLGPHQLRRIFVGGQYLMVMDIEIGAGNACNVQIKYLLQKGYTEIISNRGNNGPLFHSSLPKVVASGCSIR
jgi:hypothetical protein